MAQPQQREAWRHHRRAARGLGNRVGEMCDQCGRDTQMTARDGSGHRRLPVQPRIPFARCFRAARHGICCARPPDGERPAVPVSSYGDNSGPKRPYAQGAEQRGRGGRLAKSGLPGARIAAAYSTPAARSPQQLARFPTVRSPQRPGVAAGEAPIGCPQRTRSSILCPGDHLATATNEKAVREASPMQTWTIPARSRGCCSGRCGRR
jgi:hypothetical protein